jgi:hypothetical protein
MSEMAMMIPAMAPELMLLEEGVDVLEAAPAVAIEDDEAELVEVILLVLLPAVDVFAAPEEDAVGKLVATAIVDESRRARGRETRSPF